MLMNAEQAAREFDRDPGWFRRLAARGEVKDAFKVGKIWAAERDAWAETAAKVRKPGPKPKVQEGDG